MTAATAIASVPGAGKRVPSALRRGRPERARVATPKGGFLEPALYVVVGAAFAATAVAFVLV